MQAKALPTDLPIQCFPSVLDFELFLDREHATAPGVYVKFAKKSSRHSSVSPAEAVETALCFGWIDGRANPFDDEWWLVRFTPRRPKSIWSQKNVKTIATLTEEGRMRPSGVAAIEAAKADGRWERAYAGPATISIPDDLAAALAADSGASAFLDSMTKSDRYALLMRLQTTAAKNRAQRIGAIVEKLSKDHAASASKVKTSSAIKKPAIKKASAKRTAPRKPAVANQQSKTPTQARPSRREGLRNQG